MNDNQYYVVFQPTHSQNPLGTFSAFYSHNIGKRMFAANGFRPGVSFSRARTIWKYRLTLRYELTGTTPRAAPTNSLFQINLSGPLF
jgi:hypothetical protein